MHSVLINEQIISIALLGKSQAAVLSYVLQFLDHCFRKPGGKKWL